MKYLKLPYIRQGDLQGEEENMCANISLAVYPTAVPIVLQMQGG